MAETLISSSELSSHNERESLWVMVHGRVYNLTHFANDHPGGIEVLLEVAGTDATEPFDYVGHGEDAFSTMQKYLVGRLEGAEITVGPAAKLSTHAPVTNIARKKAMNAALRAEVLVPAAALLALVAVVGGIAKSGILRQIKWESQLQGWKGLETVQLSDLPVQFNSTAAFVAGLVLASSLLLSWAYSEFSKTLQHEKNVFTYPSIIPRRPRL